MSYSLWLKHSDWMLQVMWLGLTNKGTLFGSWLTVCSEICFRHRLLLLEIVQLNKEWSRNEVKNSRERGCEVGMILCSRDEVAKLLIEPTLTSSPSLSNIFILYKSIRRCSINLQFVKLTWNLQKDWICESCSELLPRLRKKENASHGKLSRCTFAATCYTEFLHFQPLNIFGL